ncbi:3-hydroxyisobutyryl-CoA hydrolase-like protein 5 [Cinnamomum micranthum f. kanehirae]|uniref:3-hydroxyisobutyryl-CoA hydrolase n=1 Tax=Cinnamomum micranthum f. kanehirae TaxID=337451 RepID=A0A443Q303_9MAGN|nr:3-hydroxyisobutyryl-CoA hydrolase-like protein 5 [Cinnamomum micranthum f. kanehirae]
MAQEPINPEEVVLAVEVDHVKLITLNRPRQLNVISSKVVLLLAGFLEKWEKEDDAELVIIKANDSCLEVVYRMYWLCYHIHTYKKTQVALVHGIVMGGGGSLTVPLKFSVVTEKTVFAVPEASIGFHTDCSFSYILSHLPGHLGEYLALTGARLNGKDMVAAGLATHFVPSEKLAELEKRLISLNSGNEIAVKSVIEEFSLDVKPDEESILNKQSTINKCFDKDSVEEIIKSFEAEASIEGNGWINAVLKGLKRSSPTGLKITLRSVATSSCHFILVLNNSLYSILQFFLHGYTRLAAVGSVHCKCLIREGRKQTLPESLKKEFRLTMNILRSKISGDVYEGIRALTIDKHQAPKWDPPVLDEVSQEKLDLVFQPFKEELELQIPVEGEACRWEGKFENSAYQKAEHRKYKPLAKLSHNIYP